MIYEYECRARVERGTIDDRLLISARSRNELRRILDQRCGGHERYIVVACYVDGVAQWPEDFRVEL